MPADPEHRGRNIAVAEIPANVLIGRDGTVITFDLGGTDLLQAASQAVGASGRPGGNPGR